MLASYWALADCQLASYARAASYNSSKPSARAEPVTSRPIATATGSSRNTFMVRPSPYSCSSGVASCNTDSVQGNRGIAVARPGIDAPCDIHHIGVALVLQEQRDALAAGAVVAHA